MLLINDSQSFEQDIDDAISAVIYDDKFCLLCNLLEEYTTDLDKYKRLLNGINYRVTGEAQLNKIYTIICELDNLDVILMSFEHLINNKHLNMLTDALRITVNNYIKIDDINNFKKFYECDILNEKIYQGAIPVLMCWNYNSHDIDIYLTKKYVDNCNKNAVETKCIIL